MSSIIKAKNKTAISISDFSGIFQLSRKNADTKDGSSNASKSRDFHGNDEIAQNYISAMKLETSGYNAQNISQSFDELSDAFNSEESTIQMDYCGDIFDTASVVMGELKHWYNDVSEVARPMVNLMIVPNGNCGVSAENWLRQGSAVAKVAEILQDKCDVKITASFFSKAALTDNTNIVNMVTLKDYHEDLDFRRLGAVTHPSFFRRVIFGCLENKGRSFGEAEVGWGYGRSVSSWEDLGLSSEEFQRASKTENVVLLPNAESFRNMDDTINIIKEAIYSAEGFIKGEE